jgi:hypothetical protein
MPSPARWFADPCQSQSGRWLVERRRWMRWLGGRAAPSSSGYPRWAHGALLPTACGFYRARYRGANLFLHRRCDRSVHRTHVGRGAAARGVRSAPPSLFTLTLLSIFVLYVQLILGGMFRHHGMSWWPHVVNAVVVSFVLAGPRSSPRVYSQIEAVRRPAI